MDSEKILRDEIIQLLAVSSKFGLSLNEEKLWSKLQEFLGYGETSFLYQEALISLIEDAEEFLTTRPWQKNLCSSLLGLDIKGDLGEIFEAVVDPGKFVQDFLFFKTNSKEEYIKERFKALRDFFLQVLRRDFVERMMIEDEVLEKFLDSSKKDLLARVENLYDIASTINDYLGISEAEKKNLGEVFTPVGLIQEMLDTLPSEVWSNPDLKWLDPANGIGNFQIVVFQRLMSGLKEVIPEAEERYRHIVENMLYVCDLNVKNMFIYLNLFDRAQQYQMNYYRGSFLDEGFKAKMKEWGVVKFDIVLGNPPYNSNQNAKGKRGGGDTLWDKFVIKILKNILKENGFLVFVHPTLWRKPQSEKSSTRLVNEIMMKKQILYLKMHDSKDGMKTFKAGTRYDFYCLKNCDIYTETFINDEDRQDSQVDLRKYPFIPNKNIKFFDKIVAKANEPKCLIIFNVSNYETRKKWVSDKQTEEFKYPLIHSTPKKGTRYMYSSRNDNGHFGIPKVIFGESGIYDVIIDMAGKYGMTQGAMAIEVASLVEAEKIKEVLLSAAFECFLESVLWSNFRIDWRLFKYLKKDFWREFTEEKLNDDVKAKPFKLSKSVGANIAQSSFNFQVGKDYIYRGRSKRLQSEKVKLLKELRNSFRVEDEKGNIADIAKSTLQIKN
jgi:hypothetical protein